MPGRGEEEAVSQSSMQLSLLAVSWGRLIFVRKAHFDIAVVFPIRQKGHTATRLGDVKPADTNWPYYYGTGHVQAFGKMGLCLPW